MITKLITITLMLCVCFTAEAEAIKVLILDDVFQNIPQKEDRITRMGKLRGYLLVNGNHYQGNIEVWKGKKGLFLINELPLEEYVKYVVRAEVGIHWDMEALKAQAVIARTYALFQMNAQLNSNFDLTSSVLHQVYKGAIIGPKITYAVDHTAGEVLFYEDNIIESYYHSTCGGMTENAEEVFGKSFPYLQSVESSCESSPYWIWERNIPLEEIEKALDLSGIEDVTISSFTSTGRVKTLDITHRTGMQTVKATAFRKQLGWKRLPSTKFTITRENGKIIFEGKGYGHGVGLCQWSALEMARGGMNYKEILAFYYPGTTIQIYENR